MLALVAMILAVTMGETVKAPPEPLAPSGKWVVDYEQNMCVLSHDFGRDADKITFGFRPYPLTEGMELVMILPSRLHTVRRGEGHVTLVPSGKTVTGSYVSYDVPKGAGRALVLTLDDVTAADFIKAQSIEIDAGHDRRVVAPTATAAAFKAVEVCDDDLLRSWKIDPNEEQQIGQAAKPAASIGYWLTTDDYPAEAVSAHLEGTSTIVWAIGLDGRAADCRVVVSSNVPVLDAAACNAISKRARYTPALDKSGKPMASHNSRRIVWRIPD